MTQEEFARTVGLDVNQYEALDVLFATQFLVDRYDVALLVEAWLNGDGESLAEFEEELTKGKNQRLESKSKETT
jgi:hypothetical protein